MDYLGITTVFTVNFQKFKMFRYMCKNEILNMVSNLPCTGRTHLICRDSNELDAASSRQNPISGLHDRSVLDGWRNLGGAESKQQNVCFMCIHHSPDGL